ncbi:MAG: hypothetical protein Q8Q03_01535 [bacterium]|nr:hypothetical protein [bacterium]
MTPEERSLLERTHQLAEENNEILRSIKRRNRLGTALRVFYWAVIIGISFGAFYFIQPYLDFLKGMAGSDNATSTQSNYNKDLMDLLK